ncbi:hypothetical protein GCM10010417_39730 [Streptomyces carpaticus]
MLGRMRGRKPAVVAATVAALFAGEITPALAEGSFESFIDSWRNGKESRRWYDGNTDAVRTTVSFSGCTFGAGKGGVNLRLCRDINNWPDAEDPLKIKY